MLMVDIPVIRLCDFDFSGVLTYSSLRISASNEML